MKTVLIISPERWSDHNVSKHHYARTLADMGHMVLFLDPPVNRDDIRITTVDKHQSLSIVQAPQVAKGLRYYPPIIRTSLEKAWLQQLEERIGRQIDVIWLFENSRFFDMRFAGNRLKIYHQVDLNQVFNPGVAAKTADICFCTTDLIRKQLIPFSSRVYKIHHGTAVAPAGTSLAESMKYRFSSECVHAVYIGNLDMSYLDVKLLVKTVEMHPEVQFHFVGGYKNDGRLYRAACEMQNICWWGKVESAMIPEILSHAGVLLVTYQKKHYDDQASPHKFMEYLASGKTIVATYTDEYRDKRHLIKMVDDSADYLKVFNEVVENIEVYNSIEKKRERIKYAMENTYFRQIEKINSILFENGLKELV